MSTMTQPENPTRVRANARPQRARRRSLLVVAALLVVVVVGAGLWLRVRLDPGSAVAGARLVAVRDNEFGPAAVQVPVGTAVTWRWDGEEGHNVVGDGFESPVQVDGEFVHTFAAPGTYGYRCSLHFLMRGEVVVTG